MAQNTRARSRALKVYGPGAAELSQCDFTTSGGTGAVTVNEAQGCTVARTGVGTFVVTFGRAYKALTVTYGVQGSTTAQLLIQTAKSLGSGSTPASVTFTQVTAGGSTAVDTLAMRVNVQAIGRVTAN